jgi:hypothetical protein
MPKLSKIFPNQFRRATDLDESGIVVTIVNWHKDVYMREECYALDLDDGGAPLRVTGPLGSDIRAALAGEDELDQRIGHAIMIYPVQKTIKDRDTGEDKVVDMIRAKAAPNTKAIGRNRDPDLNDEISF